MSLISLGSIIVFASCGTHRPSAFFCTPAATGWHFQFLLKIDGVCYDLATTAAVGSAFFLFASKSSACHYILDFSSQMIVSCTWATVFAHRMTHSVYSKSVCGWSPELLKNEEHLNENKMLRFCRVPGGICSACHTTSTHIFSCTVPGNMYQVCVI